MSRSHISNAKTIIDILVPAIKQNLSSQLQRVVEEEIKLLQVRINNKINEEVIRISQSITDLLEED